MSQSAKTKGYLALTATSLIWGVTWVASKIGVRELPPLQMAYTRQFIAGIIFVGFFAFFKKLALPTPKQFRWLIVMAIIMFVSANGLSTWGIQYIPAGLGSLIGALYPLSVVIIEKVFFKSKSLTAVTIIGLLLGISGIAIVSYENAFNHNGSNFLFGVFLSVTAMLSWSVGTIFMARNKVDINPYYGVGWQMIISSVILFTIMQTTQTVIPFLEISIKAWLVISFLVLFGSLLTFIAFIYSMKVLPTAISSLYAYINPFVAIITAYIVLHDKLSINILWGSIVTVTGVYLVNYSTKKADKIIAEAEI